MAEILHLLAFSFFLYLTPPVVLAAQRFNALVVPITQSNPSSTLFTITLAQNEDLVIDIESPLSWHHCPRSLFPRVFSDIAQCISAQSDRSPFCKLQIPRIPVDPPFQSCFTLPSNPIIKSCASSQLTYTNVSIYSSDGCTRMGRVTYKKIFMSCAPRSLFESLPEGSSGVASLSKGSLSLLSQFSTANVPKKFGMCLGDQGAAFFGDGPFQLLPPPETDVTRILSFTSLLNHPRDPLSYYIGIETISINGFKGVLVKGSTKLSTVTPYTTLRSHIYRTLLRQFAKATTGIPRVPKIAPFEFCLNSTRLRSKLIGLNVFPQVDFKMKDGAIWRMVGANLMKEFSSSVACLAFIDGGEMAEEAVVIGSYQMQHNFFLFDLVELRLGFSSSLLSYETTCSSFNFTFAAI